VFSLAVSTKVADPYSFYTDPETAFPKKLGNESGMRGSKGAFRKNDVEIVF
jgi:hypothetical protein